MHVQFTPGFDVAQLVFYSFVLFFLGLVVYLRREDRREGYPVEDDQTGRVLTPGGPLSMAEPKAFHLAHGHGIVFKPDYLRDAVAMPARPTARFNGAPLVPTGNPLADGIGPAAWAERRRVPDLDAEGHPRIVPLASDPRIVVARGDPTMIGWPVLGLDGRVAGRIEELWVDRPDRLVRYLQLALERGGTVLAPMAMARVDRRRGCVVIDALTADQFAGVPAPERRDILTAYDEERIVAYFGGGYLYATAARQEPLL